MPPGVSSRNAAKQADNTGLILPAPTTQDPNAARVGFLERALQMNQMRYEVLEAYYHGRHPSAAFSSVAFMQWFGRQLSGFSDNWMRLIISATNNRLRVQGFRVGSTGDTSDVDKLAWRVWKSNKLTAGSRIAHRDAMKFGTSFTLVDPVATRPDGMPVVTVESPMQMIASRAANDRWCVLDAIKKWVGDDGFLRLNYYTPQQVLKYRAASKPTTYFPNQPDRVFQPASWMLVDEVENPLGFVPIVPVENEPDILLGGLSDLEDMIPLNDGLNKTIRDMLVASEFQAFQQRYVTGVEVPKDPVTGNPITEEQAQLKASRQRVWMFPGANVKVGQLEQIDLTPYINAIDMFIHHLSMVTQTPAYMLVGKMANLSADAIRAAELGFVGKLHGKQIDYGVSHETATSYALQALSVDKVDEDLAEAAEAAEEAAQDGVETLWTSAAAHSGSILSNELTQMVALGMPQQVSWEKYGASPEEIELWLRLNEANPQLAEHLAAAAAASGLPGGSTSPIPGGTVTSAPGARDE
jgi:hypothetical protein